MATPEQQQTELKAKFEQKKLAVIAAVEGVHKGGEAKMGAGGSYNYAMEADIVRVVRKAMVESHLSFAVEYKGLPCQPQEMKARSGAAWWLYTVNVRCELTDTETGYSESYEWAGQGFDPGDKALNKAYTNAVKYFLLKTFLIPTGDDPEQDNPDMSPPKQGKQPGFPGPGEPMDKRTTQKQRQQKQAAPPAGEVPPYTHENTEAIMAALGTHFQSLEAGNFKFSMDKLKATVWARFKKWPETQHGYEAIKKALTLLDVAEEAA